MKRNEVLNFMSCLCITVFLFTFFSCTSKSLTYNYEVERVDQATQGNIMFRVHSYGKSVEDAIERAKMDAVHAVLFKGIPGSNLRDPMIPDRSVESEHAEYFKKFFGVDELANRTKDSGKTRYGSKDAPYRLYVNRSNDGAVPAKYRLKVDGGFKVGVLIEVNHKQLRNEMENEGILRGLGI